MSTYKGLFFSVSVPGKNIAGRHEENKIELSTNEKTSTLSYYENGFVRGSIMIENMEHFDNAYMKLRKEMEDADGFNLAGQKVW